MHLVVDAMESNARSIKRLTCHEYAAQQPWNQNKQTLSGSGSEQVSSSPPHASS